MLVSWTFNHLQTSISSENQRFLLTAFRLKVLYVLCLFHLCDMLILFLSSFGSLNFFFWFLRFAPHCRRASACSSSNIQQMLLWSNSDWSLEHKVGSFLQKKFSSQQLHFSLGIRFQNKSLTGRPITFEWQHVLLWSHWVPELLAEDVSCILRSSRWQSHSWFQQLQLWRRFVLKLRCCYGNLRYRDKMSARKISEL